MHWQCQDVPVFKFSFIEVGEAVERQLFSLQFQEKINSPQDFTWLMQMRFYYNPRQTDVLQQLSIHMANATFQYGFEYLGVQDKLVQTPLTDRSACICHVHLIYAVDAGPPLTW